VWEEASGGEEYAGNAGEHWWLWGRWEDRESENQDGDIHHRGTESTEEGGGDVFTAEFAEGAEKGRDIHHGEH